MPSWEYCCCYCSGVGADDVAPPKSVVAASTLHAGEDEEHSRKPFQDDDGTPAAPSKRTVGPMAAANHLLPFYLVERGLAFLSSAGPIVTTAMPTEVRRPHLSNTPVPPCSPRWHSVIRARLPWPVLHPLTRPPSRLIPKAPFFPALTNHSNLIFLSSRPHSFLKTTCSSSP
jgi:hypothetical protein